MGKWYPKRPDISTEEMKSLRATGLSFEKIGKILGLSAAGVHVRLKKAASPDKRKQTWQDITRHRMFSAAKKRAREENLPFHLVLSDIHIPELCPVFGYTFAIGTGRLNDASPTLDKIIPALGYTKHNIWVISWKANRAKSNLSVEELIALAAAVSRKQKEILWQ